MRTTVVTDFGSEVEIPVLFFAHAQQKIWQKHKQFSKTVKIQTQLQLKTNRKSYVAH